MKILALIFLFLIIFSSACYAEDCSYPVKVINVHKSGRGKFKSIQRAIDSIPDNNDQWIHIRISAGNYTEKVMIPWYKPCIFLEGTAGSSHTLIQSSDHSETSTSYTFEANAPNFIAKGVTFENTYNLQHNKGEKQTYPALAVGVRGDKSAFYDCAFKGVQDTLMDDTGRHYYKNCYIQGETDFIFGKGQTIFESCKIYFKSGPDGRSGCITSQGREFINETSGYVFQKCHVDGIGKTILGRPYRAYSRVIFANSYLSSVVDTVGWAYTDQSHDVTKLTYVEEGNSGPGANKSKRVQWMKTMAKKELNKFLSITYIDNEGWLGKQPSSFDSKKLRIGNNTV